MIVSLYRGNWTTRSLHIGEGMCKQFVEVPDGGVVIAVKFVKESPLLLLLLPGQKKKTDTQYQLNLLMPVKATARLLKPTSACGQSQP